MKLKYSVDGGVTFHPVSEGIRIVYEDALVPGEDAKGELHLYATGEGLVSDVWVTREESLDHNIGTSSEPVDDIIHRLVEANA